MMATVATSQLGGIPVIILKEGTGRTKGKEALRSNITAARVISEVVKTTLGPRGMDKMLVDSLGDVTITNDGAAILKEVDVQHPAAKMMVEVAETQDNEVGDGTTTVVVFSGELLKKAEDLLDKKIHPTTIVSGYRKAGGKAIDYLKEIAKDVDLEDGETMKKIAVTSMYSKAVGINRDRFADIAVEAIERIREKRPGRILVDKDNIQIVKKTGESLFDTKLIEGVILDKEVVHPDMPKRVKKAKIALLDCALEVEKTEIDAEIRIRNPEQMKAFLDEEEKMLRDMVTKIAATGANVVLCQKGIDDVAQYFLAKKGILAVRRIKSSDMEKLSRAVGANVVTDFKGLQKSDLGSADLVEERKIGGDKLVFIEGCKDPRSVSILIRAGLERMLDEAERSMNDALGVVADVTEVNKIVAGGGSVEAELAKRLREYAAKVGGREQLAINAFADSLEVVPTALAENAGLNPVDIMVALRSAHEKSDGLWMGVNVFTGKIADMMKEGVIEPYSVKEQVIKSAVEAASMILRIDDVIASAKAPPMPKGGAPGGPPEGYPPEY